MLFTAVPSLPAKNWEGSVLKRDFGSFHSSNVQELIKLPQVCMYYCRTAISTCTFEDHRCIIILSTVEGKLCTEKFLL